MKKINKTPITQTLSAVNVINNTLLKPIASEQKVQVINETIQAWLDLQEALLTHIKFIIDLYKDDQLTEEEFQKQLKIAIANLTIADQKININKKKLAKIDFDFFFDDNIFSAHVTSSLFESQKNLKSTGKRNAAKNTPEIHFHRISIFRQKALFFLQFKETANQFDSAHYAIGLIASFLRNIHIDECEIIEAHNILLAALKLRQITQPLPTAIEDEIGKQLINSIYSHSVHSLGSMPVNRSYHYWHICFTNENSDAVTFSLKELLKILNVDKIYRLENPISHIYEPSPY